MGSNIKISKDNNEINSEAIANSIQNNTTSTNTITNLTENNLNVGNDNNARKQFDFRKNLSLDTGSPVNDPTKIPHNLLLKVPKAGNRMIRKRRNYLLK